MLREHYFRLDMRADFSSVNVNHVEVLLAVRNRLSIMEITLLLAVQVFAYAMIGFAYVHHYEGRELFFVGVFDPCCISYPLELGLSFLVVCLQVWMWTRCHIWC